jgi:hypothetical protein
MSARITEIKRLTDKVSIKTEQLFGDLSKEKITYEKKDLPLESFDKALQELTAVVKHRFPHSASMLVDAVILGLKIKYDKEGYRTIAILIDIDSEHNEDPLKGEVGSIILDDVTHPMRLEESLAGLVLTVLEEADKYLKGQCLPEKLPLENTKDPTQQDGLDFSEEEKEFRALVEACKKKEHIFKVVLENLELDWTGADMPLSQLKQKAINMYKSKNSAV